MAKGRDQAIFEKADAIAKDFTGRKNHIELRNRIIAAIAHEVDMAVKDFADRLREHVG